ncbi:MAG: DNA mismatch repair protein MutS [Thermodesulfobacteriota bacterium]
MTVETATPMVRQYLEIKSDYPDAILFFRMGDFYEMFFEDAQKASRALSITLTSRNRNDPDPIPMCGVPHHSANRYIARLINQGFKVAICDQVEDPVAAKGLVRRDVTRVVTAGTFDEEGSIEKDRSLYTAAAVRAGKRFGVAALDLSTGEFTASEAESAAAAREEILRLAPREVLVPLPAETDPAWEDFFRDVPATGLSPDFFEPAQARETLCRQFSTQSLEGFGMADMDAAVAAAGAVFRYVRDTQKQDLLHVTRLSPTVSSAFLWLDAATARNLELFESIASGETRGTLFSMLDRTLTPMGARLLRKWMRAPLREVSLIIERQDAVEELKENPPARGQVREALSRVQDMERLRSRIALNRANGRDLLGLAASLAELPAVYAVLSAHFRSPLLQTDAAEDAGEARDAVFRAISPDAPLSVRDGGIIREGFDEELDELRSISRDAKGFIARLEAQEREKTGLSSLKVRYNKVFGYYIEISKAQSEKAPADYVRRQTLVNAERYVTEELKGFEQKVLTAEERAKALEYEIFCRVREDVLTHDRAVAAAAETVARIDALSALAQAADENDYCRPEVDETDRIAITDGRHPVVEKSLSGERYVENSVLLDNAENQVLVITGPNMAGKSTVLRQVAVTVILAQMGSFVPAKSATVGATDRIFTRVGALDNLAQGQSTFLVEMQETANILNNATDKSLVILDEIGRGTSTFDGLSIAWAVAEFLHDKGGKGVKTLFATHYHELCDLTRTMARVKNFHIAVKEWNEKIIFLRKLMPGGTNKSHGIAVARLAGVPVKVVERAREVLSAIEESDEARVRRAIAAAKSGKARGQVQLNLFPSPEELILETLEGLSLDSMTPVQALNTLSYLQEKIIGLKNGKR